MRRKESCKRGRGFLREGGGVDGRRKFWYTEKNGAPAPTSGGNRVANIIEISDLSAPELAPYTQLTHSQLCSRRAPERGQIIVESARAIQAALNAGCRPRSFLMERRHIPAFRAGIGAEWEDVPLYTAGREVLAQLTGFTLNRGILSAMARPALPAPAEVCRRARRLVVLENVTDAANVGAIFRSAAALGMDGVLATPSCCDPFYRRAIRVSMGAVFQIPWAWAEGELQWPVPGIDCLRAQGFRTAAMALDHRAVDIDDPVLIQADKLAVVLGSEGNGLPAETIAACDYTAKIPMCRGVDSLNVAAAGAVVFWQLRRREDGSARGQTSLEGTGWNE